MPQVAAKLGDAVTIWHQSGKGAQQTVEQAYAAEGQPQHKVTEFIDDMAAAYAWADVVVCRSGALTVSGIKTADVTASESITATVPLVLVKASTSITLDTPEVICTNKLTTATLEVQKGGTMRGNIEHTGGTLKSNGVQVDDHGHGGVQRGGSWTEGTR